MGFTGSESGRAAAAVTTANIDDTPAAKRTPSPEQNVAATTTQEVQIVADDQPEGEDASDANSAYAASSVNSSTTSLSPSIAQYRHENGRRYHAYKDGSYVLPNDDTENERLDLQHNLLCLTFDDKLYLSPAGRDKPLTRVLDVGTGTGIWAVDFADEHPDVEVLGVDLSPIQPLFVPPNCLFEVDDLEAPWTYTRKFDFIYVRMMSGALESWPKFLDQAYEHLNPGGWIEFADIGTIDCDDGTIPADSAIQRWTKYTVDAANKVGRPMDTARSHRQRLEEMSKFTNITEHLFKWPTNRWPKDEKYKTLGTWANENISSALQAISLALFTRVLNWTPEELEILLTGVRADMKNPQYHGYWPIYVVYAQKPEGA